MAKQIYGVSPTSVVIRLKLMNSSVTTGAGITGLAYTSSGLIISTIAIGEASAVVYTQAGSTIETITTLGTFAAPTATKCRFKEVDATNHPGVYELQLADARFATTASLLISISGATNLAQADFEVECKNIAANVIQVAGTAQTAKDLGAAIGTPVALDSGAATLAGMLTKMADNNGGASFQAVTDSQRATASAIAATAPTASAATAGAIVTGTNKSGSYVNTQTQDGVYWQVSPTGAAVLDINLTYAVGTGKSAYQVRVVGRYQSGPGRVVDIYAYNYLTSGYEKISSAVTQMQNAASDATYTYNLNANHIKTDGTANIRFLSSDTNSGSNLYLDYVPYFFTNVGASPSDIANATYLKFTTYGAIYQDGVWIDTVGGTAGTSTGYNGIPSNPVDTLADAMIIATALGFKKLYFRPNSTVTFLQTYSGWKFEGRGIIHINGQDILKEPY